METLTLTGTDMTSSRLALGTMTFGSQVDEKEAAAMLDRAVEHGTTHIDTADVYNEGAAEEIVGRWLRGRRDDVLVATKVGMRMQNAATPGGLTAKAVQRAMDASLRRLGTDHVDLYYLHTPDWSVPIEETMDAMTALVSAGKVRHVGVSNYAAWQIAQMRGQAHRCGWPPVHVSQVMYNLVTRHLEDEYAAFAREYAMANVIYNPLAGGLLTGKHERAMEPAEGTRFSGERYRRRYWHDQQFKAVGELAEIAAQAGMSLVELAYRWLLGQDLVGVVIVGASSLRQLEQNFAAAEGPELDDETRHRCDAVWEQLRGPIPRYNR
jgi:aryl-alcohol dehydrogenase-like predicted oxidoreductase